MTVKFTPTALALCIRVDLTKPENGDTFAFGEIGRRIYRASAGMPSNATLQLVVGKGQPFGDLHIPDSVRVQLVAPDAATMHAWMTAISSAVNA